MPYDLPDYYENLPEQYTGLIAQNGTAAVIAGITKDVISITGNGVVRTASIRFSIDSDPLNNKVGFKIDGVEWDKEFLYLIYKYYNSASGQFLYTMTEYDTINNLYVVTQTMPIFFRESYAFQVYAAVVGIGVSYWVAYQLVT